MNIHFLNQYDEFGSRISFWGTLGTQQLLPFWTPEQVYETAINNLAKCNGTVIGIGPTHMVESEVTWENLLAIKQAIEEYKQTLQIINQYFDYIF